VEQDARRLRRVAIIRLSKSFLREIPPFSEFPPGLTNIVCGYYCHVSGGLAIDGSLEAPIVEEEVIRECQKIKELNLTAVVIAGVFSPIDEVFKQEDHVRRIVLEQLPGVDIVCSHEVANIGFMERENAAILNASILKYARRTVGGFRSAMARLKLKCGLFLTQNDGTLVDSATAAKLPIRTFSSGATNSMRGAAYLSGIKGSATSTLVIDIGGTTSDIGVLLPSGFPRQANAYVTVAGVSVNYSMPHLESIGLGGGSIVRETDSGVTVGPDSVGHFLTSEARVFGGSTLTTTDISVAAKRSKIGDSRQVENLNERLVTDAQARIKLLLERAIDVMKTSPDPLPVLLVGGGSIIAPGKLEGAASLTRPPFHDVANAVGAAISKAGGIVDIVQGTSGQTVAEAIERAKRIATERAVASGAVESSITIAEVEAMPLQYVTNQLRTIVKAVGELDIGFNHPVMEIVNGEETFEAEEAKDFGSKIIAEPSVDPMTYRPEVIINKETGHPEWFISETDLTWLADGCYVLGCAGGGSPNSTRIQLRDQLRAGHKMRVVNISALRDDAVIYCKSPDIHLATTTNVKKGADTWGLPPYQ
jgi:N-methylhydantoinase A/oxoprolinase/acetone carboxylase beta subunit